MPPDTTRHAPTSATPTASQPSTTHDLKCWPEFFDAIVDGRKTFEVRKNDRGYQTGDTLLLRKWDPHAATLHWVGRDNKPVVHQEHAASVTMRVTYVLSGMGIEHGYVVMGIERVEEQVR